ncbi:MAG: calcineurin-like phosphoesterase family protein [Alistipes sp.]|nr:calcineurin-like phosphoesterase family protein [Candidatus Alistipes equi]
MKKILSIILIGTLLFSCSKDAVEEMNLPEVDLTITLDESTKTYLGEGQGSYPVLWSLNDKVSINGTVYTVDESCVGTSTTIFKNITEKAPYTLVYPAEYYSTLSADVQLPPVQSYVKNSFASNIAVMASSGSSSTATLYHACSFLKFDIEKGISSIVLYSHSEEQLSGEFSISFNESGKPVLERVSGQQMMRLSDIDSDASTVIISVPAAKYETGFDVYVTKDGKNYMQASTFQSGIELKPGVIYKLAPLTFSVCKDKTFSKVISSADELAAFLKEAHLTTATTDVILGNDIDMSTLSPSTALEPASDFLGTFDGAGHMIKNWGTTQNPAIAGLFLQNHGTIKNLTIDSSCHLTFSEPKAVDTSYGIIVAYNEGRVEGCVNNSDLYWNNAGRMLGYRVFAGALVGYTKTGLIQNCINNGNVTYEFPEIYNTETQATCTQYFGGAFGRTYDADMKNCVNNGNLTLICGKIHHATYLAGVVASANSSGAISGCKNNGNITYKSTGAFTGGGLAISGIVSYAATSVSDCKNNGNISCTSDDAISTILLSGVVSYVSQDVSHCINHGDVFFQAPSTTIGTLTTNFYAKGVYPCFSGVVGVNHKSNITDCENYGKVTVNYTNYGKTATGYPGVGGVLAMAGGEGMIENCTNYGEIRFNAETPGGSRMNNTTGRQVWMGGICSANMSNVEEAYAMLNGYMSIKGCRNYGNVIFNSDFVTSNNYIGGIVGQGDKELEGIRMKLTDCENYGEVQGLGFSKCRLGGIAGANTTIENCKNTGRIYANENVLATSQMGGIIGFLRYHTISGNETTGKIECLAPATCYVGGLIGQSSSGMGAILGCSVNCEVVSKNAPNSDISGIGIVSGWTTSSTSAPFTYGTPANPIIVGGTLYRGMSSIIVTATNYNVLEYGSPSVIYGRTDSNRGVSYALRFHGSPVVEYLAEGYVKDTEGNPLKDVAVSDGFSVTTTNSDGYYKLRPISDSWYIFYSIPSYAEVGTGSAGQPLFYTRYNPQNTRYDFTIKKLPGGVAEKSFNLFCLADPQARAGTMANRFRDETVPAIKARVATYEGNSYGVTLGDVVYSEGGTNTNANMPTMQSHMSVSKIGMPVFQTMGNHDYTYFYGSSNPIKADDTSSTFDLKAQRAFEDVFGPINHSWNRAKTHIICMRNIIYNSQTDASSYTGGFTDDQYRWLQQDLAVVPKDYQIILCVHIPFASSSAGGPHMKDAVNLMKQFASYHIMSGHTHYMRNETSMASLGIFEHVHAAICGAWWHSNLNGDGCPNGYGVYQITDNTIKSWRYYGSNNGMNDTSYQLRLYRGNQKTGGQYEYFQRQQASNVLYANVFDADSKWVIKVYENGTYKGTMTKVTVKTYKDEALPAVDPSKGSTLIPNDSSQDWWAIGYNIGVVGRGHKGGKRNSYMTGCYHMYKYTLSNANAQVKVVATNQFGDAYECTTIEPDLNYPPYCKSGNH